VSSSASRDRVRLQEAFRASAAMGDFVAAEKAARALAALVASNAEARWHGIAADELVDVFLETKRVAEAGAVAREFLATKDGWAGDVLAEDQAIARDATPRMLAAARRAGLLAAEPFVAARAAWVDAWRAKAAPFYAGYVWLHGYAATAETAQDAREALDVAAQFGGVPRYRPNGEPRVSIGWLDFLAGRTADATPLLRSAARMCSGVSEPIAAVRAHYQLGRALEDGGDASGACAEYKVVLERWGHAKPASATADEARARARTLGCAR
jgi:hypothetical protein